MSSTWTPPSEWKDLAPVPAPTAEDQTLSPTYRSKLSRAPLVFQGFFPEGLDTEMARRTLLDRVTMGPDRQHVTKTVKHGTQTRGETEEGILWVQYETNHGATRDVLRVSSKSCNLDVDGTFDVWYKDLTNSGSAAFPVHYPTPAEPDVPESNKSFAVRIFRTIAASIQGKSSI